MTKPLPPFFDDEDYQDRLTRVLQMDAEALKQCGGLIHGDDFKPIRGHKWGRPRWIVAERALDFYQNRQEPIGKLLRSEVISYATDLQLPPRQMSEIEDYLKHLSTVPVVPAEAVIKKIIQFKQERQRASVLQEMVELHAGNKLTPELWRELSEPVYDQVRTVEAVSAATLFSTDYPAPAFAVNNKLPTGLAMLAAKPKMGKTYMALQMAGALARGDELFLGGKVKTPGPVLYIALEDGDRRISERLHQLAPKAKAAEFNHLHVLHHWIGFAELRSAMAKHAYKLVVIDPYLATIKERKTQDIVRADYSEFQPYRKLAEEFKTTILIVHHLRKAAGEARDLIIGTTGVTAAVDTLWILTNVMEDDRTKCLKITGRDVRERSLRVELNLSAAHRGWRVVADGPVAEAGGPLQRGILELLADAGPMPASAVAGALNASTNSVAVTLSKMRQNNLVEKHAGKYAYPGRKPVKTVKTLRSNTQRPAIRGKK